METRDVRRGNRLTKEQEELRQRGLRLLARIIARHHLASLAQEKALRASACDAHLAEIESGPVSASDGESPIEAEDEHAR